jgi:hypothetical protein
VLVAGGDVDAAAFAGDRQGAVHLEVHVLLASRHGLPAHAEGSARHGRLGLSTGDHVGIDVVVASPDRFVQIAHGRQGLPVDPDELQSLPGLLPALGVDRGHRLAHAVDLPRGQQGLVRLDGADLVLAGDVVREEHGVDAGERTGLAGVGGQDARPGVGRGQHHAVQHPGGLGQIVDVAGGARDVLPGAVVGEALAEGAGHGRSS